MRQFKLWNASQTEAFDFTAQGCLITEVSGLGINFNTTINNRAVVEYQREFDEITLLANFGINANAYSSYNQFAAFVAANGRNRLIIEYKANNRTLYSDVWLKRMPKTQKTNYGLLSEQITFSRLSYWYQLETGTIPAAPSYIQITNDFFEDLMLDIEIRSTTPNDFRIQQKTLGGTIVSQIIIPLQITSGTIALKTEEKTVIREVGGVLTNGYNLVSREGDTFAIIEPGTIRISTNAAVTNQPVFVYKKWVID